MGGAGRSPTRQRPCCATRRAARRSWRPCSCPWKARPRVRPARCSTTFPPTTRRAGPGSVSRLAPLCRSAHPWPSVVVGERTVLKHQGRWQKGRVVTRSPCYPGIGGEEHASRALLDVLMPKMPRLGDASDCPEPDARLLTAHVELAHVDEVARWAQEGLASRIRNEN